MNKRFITNNKHILCLINLRQRGDRSLTENSISDCLWSEIKAEIRQDVIQGH